MFLRFRARHLAPNVAANKLRRSSLMRLRKTRRRKLPAGLRFLLQRPVRPGSWLTCRLSHPGSSWAPQFSPGDFRVLLESQPEPSFLLKPPKISFGFYASEQLPAEATTRPVRNEHACGDKNMSLLCVRHVGGASYLTDEPFLSPHGGSRFEL